MSVGIVKEQQRALTLCKPILGKVLLFTAAIFDYMGQAESAPHYYTPADYFALEEHSQVRHEFFEGEVFAMVGASITHNTIAGNICMVLRQHLRGKKAGCRWRPCGWQ